MTPPDGFSTWAWLPAVDPNTTQRDIFTRENVVEIGTPETQSAITHMRIVLNNTFAPLPLNGQPYASAQFLGTGSTEFAFTLANVGDGTIQNVQMALEETQKNARQFRRVKNGNRIRFEGNPLLDLADIRDGIVSSVDSFTDDGGTDLYGLRVAFTVDNNHTEELGQEFFISANIYWDVIQQLVNRVGVTVETINRSPEGASSLDIFLGDTGLSTLFHFASLEWLITPDDQRFIASQARYQQFLDEELDFFSEPGDTVTRIIRSFEALGQEPPGIVIPRPARRRSVRDLPSWENVASDEQPAWFRTAVDRVVEVMQRHKTNLPIHEFFRGDHAGDIVVVGNVPRDVATSETTATRGESEGTAPGWQHTNYHVMPEWLQAKTFGTRLYYNERTELLTAVRSYLSDLLAIARPIIYEHANAPEFNTLFPGLYTRFINARRLSARPAYPDLDLPAHPVSGLVIDTEPDFYFWNDSEMSILNNIGPEINVRLNRRIDRLMTSFNAMGDGTLWRQVYAGRSLTGPENLQENLDYSLSNEMAGLEAWDDATSASRHDGRLQTLERQLVGDRNSVAETAMAISPTIVGSGQGARSETGDIQEGTIQERRFQMYRNTVYSTPVEPGTQMQVGPRDQIAREDQELTAARFLGHSFTAENCLNLAKQNLIQNPDMTLTMRRAFPTFKLYFIEDDTGEDREHLLPEDRVVAYFDDFYSYNSVKEIRLVRSRKQPADLLIVTLTNVSGLLDERQWRHNNTENWEPGLQETEFENPLKYLVLKQGLKVQLRLGFSNNPHKLANKFVGEVVEVSYTQDTPDLITIVAQSYGTELVAEKKGQQENYIAGYRDTADLLHSLMCSPEMVHFGRFDINPQFNPAEARSRISSGTGSVTDFNEMLDQWRQLLIDSRFKWILSNNPADDNIYAPDASTYMNWWERLKSTIQPTLAAYHRYVVHPLAEINRAPRRAINAITGGISNFLVPEWVTNINGIIALDNILGAAQASLAPTLYYPLGSTVWEMFKEMELRHPGYVGLPRTYGTRMTMFYGIPDQRYWADQITEQEMLYLHRVEESFRQRQREIVSGLASLRFDGGSPADVAEEISSLYTFAFSMRDLLGYQIVGNARMNVIGELIGRVLGRFKPFRKYHLITSDHHILINNIKASDKNTFNCVHLTYGGGKSYTLRADDNIPDDKLSVGYFNYPNCVDDTMARRYCIGLLMRHLKDVYKGELIVTGMNVDPADGVMLYDTYTDMFGPFEVEQVVDTFTRETGWITELTPDLCVHSNEWSTSSTWDLMYDATGELFSRYTAASTALAVAAPFFPPIGAGAILATLGGYYFIQYTQERQPIWIQPLILNNRPFVEGLHGFRDDSIFANIAGRLVAAIDHVQEGWRAFHLLSYLNDATIPLSQEFAGQTGAGSVEQNAPITGAM